jgi:TonB family protein
MESVCKFEDFATSFPAYIDELHDFFRSRGVGFGAAEDVAPAVERMCADAVFGGEIASLVRAIIYRERDGLSPIELFELLLVAIGGAQVDEAAEEIHEPARQLLAFTKGAFHSRWTAGLESGGDASDEIEVSETPQADDEAELEPSRVTLGRGELAAAGPEDVAGGELQAETGESGDLIPNNFGPAAEAGAGGETRPHLEVFYRASMVAANGKQHEWPVEVEMPAAEPVDANPVTANYVARRVSAASEGSWFEPMAPRTEPWRWMGMAGVCAVVLAICAGVWAHGRTDVERGAARKDAQHHTQDAQHHTQDAQHHTQVAKGVAAAGQKPSPAVQDGRYEQAAAMIAAAEQRGRDKFVDQPDGDDSGGDVGPSAEAPVMRVRGRGRSHGARVQAAGGPASRTIAAEPVMRPATTAASPLSAATSGTRREAVETTAGAARYGGPAATMASQLLYAPEPEYPTLARLAHIQGKVVVEAVVARDGSVVAANVLSGHRLLRGAAVRAVMGRRYRPYTLNDRPARVATTVTVDFRRHP